MKKEWLIKTLALCVVVLFISSGVSSAFNTDNKSKPLSNGNWLYVGGSGEGNYTKIQDAIDNASNGDTVFVYNGTYYENIQINKTIDLIGEYNSTTIIDGSKVDTDVTIVCPQVDITGFTIRNSGTESNNAGIYMNSNFNKIENNIISYNCHGVFLDGNYCSDNIIRNNTISNNAFGITIESGSNNDILYNYISNNRYIGILIRFTSNYNNISYNQILNNKYGIEIHNNSTGFIIYWVLPANIITSNNISFNGVGIYIFGLVENHILKNNFIFNYKNAYFMINTRNIWIGNYWNRTRFLPYPIFGMTPFSPWINIDWYPAKKPYKIPVGG